jgi:hypothetical protein
LLYSSFTQTNVSCYGLNDGSATVNISGGVTDYILSWDTLTYPLLGGLSVFTTPVGVPAGIYPYMVTDNTGCIIYDTITITGASQILSTPTITNVSCYGLSDGSASLLISGGSPSYTEDWGIDVHAPSAIKKFATGKGNAKKEDMYASFVEETGVDLSIILDQSVDPKVNSPISDIVDAYYIAKLQSTL